MQRLPLLVIAAAVLLTGAATVALRSADPELAGVALLIPVLIAGAGVGASVVSRDPHR